MKNNTIRIATMLALGTALISGVSVFINKFAVTVMKDPVFFTMMKNSLVAIAFIGIILLFKKRKEILSLSKSQYLKLFLIGIIGGALPFILFFVGLSHTSAINGAMIHKTLFLWVAILAIPFLKERMVWQQWLGIALVFTGNLFIGGFNGFTFNIGEIMILAATILWAVENIIAKKVLADVSSITVGASRMIIGSVLLIIYTSFSSGLGPILSLTSVQWGWVIISGALLTAYVLTWYSALARAPAIYVATLLVPATLITNLLSAIFITHTITSQNIASALLYITGAFLLIFFAKRTADNMKSNLINENETFHHENAL